MAGIYIHIPFCKQACFYCDFHFSVNRKLQGEIVQAICKEIVLNNKYLKETEIRSIYFGGGTPSLLSEEELNSIMQSVFKNFPISSSAEITLEANPDDITDEKVKVWNRQGINRLSIGIQSFRDQDLKWMNRAHNSNEALKAAQIAKDNGIENLSLDLIYGIPDMDKEAWISNIEQALSLNPTHLSCYSLTVEEDTPLYKLIATNRAKAPLEGEASKQFTVLMDIMKEKGWEHYEISNFCKPGHEAVHNSNYWNGIPYLGIGPSAHSYNGVSRQWNVSHNLKYLEALNKGEIPMEMETLSEEDVINEYILVSLRTNKGCDLERIQELDANGISTVERAVLPYINDGSVLQMGSILYLTEKGKQIADRIASDLFVG